MMILRGKGPRPPSLPFSYSPARGRRNARLRRLIAKGFTGHETKADMRAAADAAAASHPIQKVP